jgi:hypothetical protein
MTAFLLLPFTSLSLVLMLPLKPFWEGFSDTFTLRQGITSLSQL